MIKLFVYGLLLLSECTASGQRHFSDPMANITPVRSGHSTRTQERKGVSGKRHNIQVRNHAIPATTVNLNSNSSAPETSLPDKRDADRSQIVDTAFLQSELHIQGSNDQEADGQCTYTFIVPRSSEQCMGTTTQQVDRQNIMAELQRDVHDTKAQVNDIKSKIDAKKQDVGQILTDIETLQQSVDVLQQESRNTDSRVSQLYMQLLHEIINKRDNSLEMSKLENKLLNQTVDYYLLKDEHEKLKQEHNELRLLINGQSQQLEVLRQQIQFIISQKQSSAPLFTSKLTTPNIQEVRLKTVNTTLPAPTTNFPAGPFRDCAAVQRSGYTKSGIFNLKLPGYDKKIRVWCDFDQDPGGWIVVQRRSGRRVNFYRNMAAYEKGFGRAHSDYWLGLEHLHRLTNQSRVNFKLHIDMEDWDGRKTFVEYQSFRVEGAGTGYKLKINHYSGTAGDSLTWHNNMRFTTMDVDNDKFSTNCARIHRGGWWYNNCARSNLNGIYYRGGEYRNQHQDGVYWSEWRGGSYSLKSVAMKIRPTE